MRCRSEVMKPTKYARAAAREFIANNWTLETGWHTHTEASVEPQKAMFDLRGLGVVVAVVCLRKGVYRYTVEDAASRMRCCAVVEGVALAV